MTTADWIQLVALFAVVASLLIVGRHFRLSCTLEYMRRMSDPDMTPIRTQVDTWLNGSGSPQDKIDALKADPQLHGAVRCLLGNLTQLGVAYKYWLFHRRMARSIWNPMVPKYHAQLQFYIDWRRSEGYPTGYYLAYLSRKIEANPVKEPS